MRQSPRPACSQPFFTGFSVCDACLFHEENRYRHSICQRENGTVFRSHSRRAPGPGEGSLPRFALLARCACALPDPRGGPERAPRAAPAPATTRRPALQTREEIRGFGGDARIPFSFLYVAISQDVLKKKKEAEELHQQQQKFSKGTPKIYSDFD